VLRCSVSCDEGRAGENVALFYCVDTKREEIERGQVLAKPGSSHRTRSLRQKCLHPSKGLRWSFTRHSSRCYRPHVLLPYNQTVTGACEAARGR